MERIGVAPPCRNGLPRPRGDETASGRFRYEQRAPADIVAIARDDLQQPVRPRRLLELVIPVEIPARARRGPVLCRNQCCPTCAVDRADQLPAMLLRRAGVDSPRTLIF